MKNGTGLAAALLVTAGLANAQMGKTTDWWTFAGDAQRSGWEKADQKFTKEDVKGFQLLWKMKLDNPANGLRAITAPVILGNLIGYRGFKELAFYTGSGNKMWSIDADLGRMYWQKQYGDSPSASNPKNNACLATVTATPSLPPPIVFRVPSTPRPAAATPRPAGPNPGPGASPAPAPAVSPQMRRFMTKPVFMLTSDGKLRRLNQSDGSELQAAVQFVPAGSRPGSLNVAEDVLYTTTDGSCGDRPATVYSLQIAEKEAHANSFAIEGLEKDAGLSGVTLGTEGEVYVQTGQGSSKAGLSKYANSLLQLEPKSLKPQGRFDFAEEKGSAFYGAQVTSPIIFSHKKRDIVATLGPDGRLYLLDAASLADGDHKTPLFRSEPLIASKRSKQGETGQLATFEEAGNRYILATVSGALNDEMKIGSATARTPNGAVVAFKLEEQNGKPSLTPIWKSADLESPSAPVIAQGVVFVLSNGKYSKKIHKRSGGVMIEEQPKGSSHATTYALDALTGQQLYSTGNQITSVGNLNGLSIANSRLYFVTNDNTAWVFGKYLEH